MKKYILIAISIVAIFYLGKGVYYYHTYFFNPFTFKNDQIVHLPYEVYKNPMGYTFSISFPFGKENGYIKSKQEVKFLYKELRESTKIGDDVEHHIDLGTAKGWLSIYNEIDSEEDRSVVTNIYWFGEDSNIIKVSGLVDTDDKKIVARYYVEMTPKLRDFFLKKTEEIKSKRKEGLSK